MPSIALKLIAIITMFIDHFAAGLGDNTNPLITGGLYSLMRGIGRTAFPLFCFMIVEGFIHTRSRARYLIRLALFCFVSEFPFDYIFNWYQGTNFMLYDSQNVFFTLTIGLMALIAVDRISEIYKDKGRAFGVVSAILQIGVIFSMCYLADLLSTDYGGDGVLLIAMIWYLGRFGKYTVRETRDVFASEKIRYAYSAAAVALWFVFFDFKNGGYFNESYGFAAVLLILCYNGQKGPKLLPKGFFYVFYPAHLMVIGMVEHIMVSGKLF